MKPATISRCFGGHVDEARELIAGDAGTGFPMLRETEDGRWRVFVGCPKCPGHYRGQTAAELADAQAVIARAQQHIVEHAGMVRP